MSKIKDEHELEQNEDQCKGARWLIPLASKAGIQTNRKRCISKQNQEQRRSSLCQRRTAVAKTHTNVVALTRN